MVLRFARQHGAEVEQLREGNSLRIGPAVRAPPGRLYTGTAVFRPGLKNGNPTTFAVTFCRTASIVISICNLFPACACPLSTLANAIIFFNTGDHVVEVAFPTCLLPE